MGDHSGTEKERRVKFWECDPDAEILGHTTIEDAVMAHVEFMARPWPESVTVRGMAPMKLAAVESIANYILEDLEEGIFEHLLGPEGEGADELNNDEVKAAAVALAQTIHDTWEPWACEEVETREVLVSDCVPEDWLK